jgi:hypothetical protein
MQVVANFHFEGSWVRSIEPVATSPLDFLNCGLPASPEIPARSMRRARDGSVLWWGEANTLDPVQGFPPNKPRVVIVAVSPIRPGHSVMVEYRVNKGPVRQAVGLLEPMARDITARTFRAVLPGQSGGLVEFLPVLRFAGHPISPRLAESVECPGYQVVCGGAPAETVGQTGTPSVKPTSKPRFDRFFKFLWTATVTVRKEVVGTLPDGLRINWHLVEGSFAGPDHQGILLPGAADHMRIRRDGIGVVDVTELLETREGARLYCSYGGVFDLGADGYARALRNEFNPQPSFMVAPTYATSDEGLSWINRAQCIGLGSVDMKALRLEYDVYVVGVGKRK